MLVLLMHALFSLTAVVEAKIANFLFAGQSNMLGYFDRTRNFTSRRFDQTMALLLSTGSDDQILLNLVNHLKTAVSDPATPTSVYEREAAQLLRYRRIGYLTSDYKKPIPNATCSLYEYERTVDYRVPGTEGKIRAENSPLSPYARCGYIFGPDLMCGQVFQYTPSRRPLRILKVAASATSLVFHWSKENGLIWPQLVKRIKTTIDTDTEEWKAIVWFQGETDSYSNSTAFGYQEDLRQFIADVRKEVHMVDSTTFDQPIDIPVVIVGLGCWASTQTSHGPIVMEAQRSFVASTQNTMLVTTNDLACDKHYDDASLLIIGARVGYALKKLLSPPTKVPTHKPTKIPTRKPTRKPIRKPTPKPTSTPKVITT
jgi:hypothetical protein